MGDDQIVISSGQAITPETVLSRSFSSAFRGYHPAEVRQFLKQVSDEMAAGAEREAQLRQELQEARARAAHPELDEATVTGILGEHAARLLAGARETAASITAEAQQRAEAFVREGEARIARLRAEADGLLARRVTEADAAADSIRKEAEVAAGAVIERATQQGKEMVGEARAVRERMLADLSRRRRSAQLQIEQLRAARDRLLAAYDVVRRTVDEATAELEAAEPEARLAAEEVGRRAGDLNLDALPERLASPARPPAERARTPVSVGAPGLGRERRDMPSPSTSLFRRLEEPSPVPPAPPEPPRLRPQTVAGSIAGRLPSPALPPATLPPVAEPDPPAPEPVSELATSEVPIITVDPPGPVIDHLPTGVIDDLFARMRADHPEPEADVTPAAIEPLDAPADETPAPAPSVDVVSGERALEGRDALLENLEAGLARALKRLLGDEQNEVLDALRRLGPSAPEGVLPGFEQQLGGYRDAALPWLQQAARAGAGFVTDPEMATEAGEVPTVDAVAGAVAVELVEPMRARLTRALAAGTDAGDPSVAAESLRATYRQWKVQQVEECARHHVVAAFSLGAFAATSPAAMLQWLVDEDGHCPDCDDNALAGPTAKGQAFPTGQLHPPAHPGCRCLLVPVSG
ncbi:MAG TPA: DivIVA domain-containing protein [Acidimicrobiales bacterium]|nr:DivIVA domain-containing protein [Acidimicrobiales bacterium]